MIVSVGIQVVNLMMLNELQIKKRVKHGKQAAVEDKSMKKTYHSFESGKDAIDDAGMLLGQQAFLDLTDQQNDEFVYIYWKLDFLVNVASSYLCGLLYCVGDKDQVRFGLFS